MSALTPAPARALRELRAGPRDEAELCRVADVKPAAVKALLSRGLAHRDGPMLSITPRGRAYLARRDNRRTP